MHNVTPDKAKYEKKSQAPNRVQFQRHAVCIGANTSPKGVSTNVFQPTKDEDMNVNKQKKQILKGVQKTLEHLSRRLENGAINRQGSVNDKIGAERTVAIDLFQLAQAIRFVRGKKTDFIPEKGK